MDLNTEKIEKLLKDKKWSEVKELLDEFFKVKLTPEEKGSVYLKFIQLYARVQTELNKQYVQEMQDLVGLLGKINAKEDEIDTQIGIAQTKDKIDKIK